MNDYLNYYLGALAKCFLYLFVFLFELDTRYSRLDTIFWGVHLCPGLPGINIL